MGQFEALIGINPWTALFVLLNTLTIFFVGKKFLFGPVMKMIRDRQKEIDDQYAAADEAKQAAMAMEAEYREKLSTASETSERIVKEAMVRGQSRQAEIIRQANEEASALKQKASADIAQEKKKALNDAKDEITVIAMAIAAKVVAKELSQEHQQQLVDEFINELGEGQ